MISHIDIAAAQKDYKPTDRLIKYINKKFGKLDRHMAKKNRPESRVEVKLKKEKTKSSGDQFACEAILHTPEYKLTAQETTTNMFASVDVVERKLQQQLKKQKETHRVRMDKKLHRQARGFLGKMWSR